MTQTAQSRSSGRRSKLRSLPLKDASDPNYFTFEDSRLSLSSSDWMAMTTRGLKPDAHHWNQKFSQPQALYNTHNLIKSINYIVAVKGARGESGQRFLSTLSHLLKVKEELEKTPVPLKLTTPEGAPSLEKIQQRKEELVKPEPVKFEEMFKTLNRVHGSAFQIRHDLQKLVENQRTADQELRQEIYDLRQEIKGLREENTKLQKEWTEIFKQQNQILHTLSEKVLETQRQTLDTHVNVTTSVITMQEIKKLVERQVQSKRGFFSFWR